MALRDIFIIVAVMLLALISLRRPWIGVMNWTWVSIMNPHRYSWSFAFSAPVAALAAIPTLIGLLFTKERRSPFQGAPSVWLLLFTCWITVSWLLGYDPAGDYAQWDKVIKIYLMTFVALSLLHTKHQLMAFAWVTIGSLALLGAKGGLFTVLTGGDFRVWGPPGSFIEDNNHFALAVIMCIPMLHFLQLQLQRAWQSHVMNIVILLCIASAIGSHSRGAFVALLATASIFWWRSSKKALIGSVLIISAAITLIFMPENWWERMGTISNYQEDGSAMGRINAWLVAIEVAKSNFFGAGMTYVHDVYFSMYGVHETNARAAHSIYFHVLGAHGFVGLFLFLMIWITAFLVAGRLRKEAAAHKEAHWAGQLGAMVQVSLVAYATGGAFLSLSYFDLPYNLMVLVVLTRKWVHGRAWETERNVTFLESAGITRKKRRPHPSKAT